MDVVVRLSRVAIALAVALLSATALSATPTAAQNRIDLILRLHGGTHQQGFRTTVFEERDLSNDEGGRLGFDIGARVRWLTVGFTRAWLKGSSKLALSSGEPEREWNLDARELAMFAEFEQTLFQESWVRPRVGAGFSTGVVELVNRAEAERVRGVEMGGSTTTMRAFVTSSVRILRSVEFFTRGGYHHANFSRGIVYTSLQVSTEYEIDFSGFFATVGLSVRL
jgi:hypothetical protein